MRLPEGFAFGVATAGFQIEGAFNGPGEPRTNWFDREASGRIERSGAANDSWNRWEEDLDAAAAMGLDWYRLSVEWARLQPSARSLEASEPSWSEEAVERYADILAGALERGLEPVVTLHHFTHPRWLGLDLWQRPEAPGLFAAYAGEAARRLGDALAARGRPPIRRYVTLNEPNGLALGTWQVGMFPGGGFGRLGALRRGLDHLMAAHALAYDAVHDVHAERGWPEPAVTTNVYSFAVYELDRGLVDLLEARRRGVVREGLASHLRDRRADWTEGLAGMAGPHRGLLQRASDALSRRVAAEDPAGSAAADALYGSPRAQKLDAVAVDVYVPWMAGYLRAPGHRTAGGRSVSPVRPLWDDPPRPASFEAFVRAAGDHGLPVWILENGLCSRVRDGVSHPRTDGWTRHRYLAEHLAAVAAAVEAGVPVEAYVHWTLFDNYEWGSYEPRFGLRGIDRTGPRPRRLALDSMGQDSARAYAEMIGALRG